MERMHTELAGSAAGPSTGEGDPLEGQFEAIGRLLYATAGIALNESKRELVLSRLTRRLRQLGAGSIRDYVALVSSERGRDELTEMVDLLTTNKTDFFREPAHFDVLADLAAGRPRTAPPMTVWSAGCSTGEEPYSIAMILHDRGGGARGARILATDLSARVLAQAREGVYPGDRVQAVPRELRERHFVPAADPGRFRVSEVLRDMVHFGRLNLMDEWPMRGPFDAIFCRNVMIYFDAPTRERLVNRLASLLAPDGFLFVGHSESLSALSHPLRYVQPATYRR